MSFILDALRKSESRRRAGEAPRLESSPSRRPPPKRSGRMRTMLLIVPLSIAFLAAALFVLRPDWLPDQLVGVSVPGPDPAAPAAVLPEQEEEVEERSVLAPGAEHALVAADPRDLPESALEDLPASEPQDPLTQRRRRREPPAEPQASMAAEPRERVVTDHAEAMAEIERQVAARVREQEQRRVREPAPVEQRPEPAVDVEPESESGPESDPRMIAAEDPQAAEAPDREVSTEVAWRPDVAEYVRAWELPLSIRRELPDLKLTIHVFSPQEEGRFVLINGERYVPGDSLEGGAQLVDIRREGAIVDFREHRFLLEP